MIYGNPHLEGPLGPFAVAKSNVQRIGYNPLKAQGGPLEQAVKGGGGGFGFSLTQPQGYTRGQYESTMADIYANTRVGTDAFGNAIYGYTGQDDRSTGSVNMSMAGTRIDTNPYVYGSRINAPLGGVGSSNPRKNYFNGRRVTGGR
jgi:hypothetical protein